MRLDLRRGCWLRKSSEEKTIKNKDKVEYAHPWPGLPSMEKNTITDAENKDHLVEETPDEVFNTAKDIAAMLPGTQMMVAPASSTEVNSLTLAILNLTKQLSNGFSSPFHDGHLPG